MHHDDDRLITNLKFERRREERRRFTGCATVTFSDGDGHVGLGSVELIDVSDRGLGVRTDMRIEPGMCVTLYPTTCGVGPSTVDAIATHCERCRDADGDEWFIGLRVDDRMAA